MVVLAYLTLTTLIAYFQNDVGSTPSVVGASSLPEFGSRIIVLFVALFFLAILLLLLWIKRREVDEKLGIGRLH